MVKNKDGQVRKAGFVGAVIAGICGAVVPSSFLMMGSSLDGPLGRIGIVCSLGVVVLGLVALKVKSWIPGSMLIVCAIAGSTLGGPLFAVFMVFAVVGVVLAFIEPMIIGSKRHSS